jgi:hypothetical protein
MMLLNELILHNTTYIFQYGRVSIQLAKNNSQQRYKITTVYKLALGPTHRPIQWVPVVLPLELKRNGREAKHVHLVPRVRMSGGVTPLLHMP